MSFSPISPMNIVMCVLQKFSLTLVSGAPLMVVPAWYRDFVRLKIINFYACERHLFRVF